MSCTPSPTATQYTTITTSTISTSFSQSVGNNQVVTTIVQQTCIASGLLNGSTSGCLSTADITQVNTIGGGGSTNQVPVIVTVPVTQTVPTKTLFGTCSDGSTPTPTQAPAQAQTTTPSTSTQSTTSSILPVSVTTSVLVYTTPPPSIITHAFSTTLSNGDVVPTTVVLTSTLPPSSVYVASTIANPSITSNQMVSNASGTNVAPIVGGVVGGLVALVAIAGALWYLCRRRTSWDDIFEREEIHVQEDDFERPIAVRRERDRNKLDLGAEPKPYQYGLVGHVVPPSGSISVPSTSSQSTALHNSGMATSVRSDHSRNTSNSPSLGVVVVPEKGGSRPSTAGSIQAAQTLATQRHLSATSQSTDPRSLSMISTNSSAPLMDGSASPSLSIRVNELGAFDPLNQTGRAVPASDRRVLQIINDGPQSPASSVAPVSFASARLPNKGGPAPRPSSVVYHTDGGQSLGNPGGTFEPPPYSRN